MRYTVKEDENPDITSIIAALGFSLIEMVVSKHRGSVQVKAVIYNGNSIGVDDCTKVHRAITPRLDLLFEGQDIYLEVSSPGVERLIKDGSEFAHYTGRKLRCYRTDISDWTAGVLEASDEKGIELNTNEGAIRLEYDIIAKAKLM